MMLHMARHILHALRMLGIATVSLCMGKHSVRFVGMLRVDLDAK